MGVVKTTADQVGAAEKLIIAGNGVAGGSMFWAWLGSNHEQVTAVCAIFGALVALVGLVIQINRGRQ